MRTTFLVFVVSLSWVSVDRPVFAGLVLNGGFETKDFTNWNYKSTDQFSFVASGFSHSGNYAAWFGDSLEDGGGSISQTLATTASEQYILSFWFAGNGDTPSGFSAVVGGTTLFNLTNPPYDENYNLYTFNFTATSASTLLEFDFHDDPFYINLDDVDVEPAVVPAPSSVALAGIGLVAIAAFRLWSHQVRRKQYIRLAV